MHQANRLRYTFLAGKAGEEMKEIGTGSTQLLSTECMNCTFTGCFAGMFARETARHISIISRRRTEEPSLPDLRFEKISHCAGVFVFGGERKN